MSPTAITGPTFVTQDVVVRYAAKPVTYGATLKFTFD